MFGIRRFAGRPICLLVGILYFQSFAIAQKKSQNSEPATAKSAAPDSSQPDKDKQDPLFQGMKYRLIGPFRGGRSLTAAGIPGDPTT